MDQDVWSEAVAQWCNKNPGFSFLALQPVTCGFLTYGFKMAAVSLDLTSVFQAGGKRKDKGEWL